MSKYDWNFNTIDDDMKDCCMCDFMTVLIVCLCVTGDAAPDQEGHVWGGADGQWEYPGLLYRTHAGQWVSGSD